MHNSHPCILEHVVQEKVSFLKFSYSVYITFLWTSYVLEVINKAVWTSYLLEVINKAAVVSLLVGVCGYRRGLEYLVNLQT